MNTTSVRAGVRGALVLSLAVSLAGAAQGCLSRYEIGDSAAPGPDEGSMPEAAVPDEGPPPGPDAAVLDETPGPDVPPPPPDVPVVGPDAGPPRGFCAMQMLGPLSRCFDFESDRQVPPDPTYRPAVSPVASMGMLGSSLTVNGDAANGNFAQAQLVGRLPGTAFQRYTAPTSDMATPRMPPSVRMSWRAMISALPPPGVTMCVGAVSLQVTTGTFANFALCITSTALEVFRIEGTDMSVPTSMTSIARVPGVPAASRWVQLGIRIDGVAPTGCTPGPTCRPTFTLTAMQTPEGGMAQSTPMVSVDYMPTMGGPPTFTVGALQFGSDRSYAMPVVRSDNVVFTQEALPTM